MDAGGFTQEEQNAENDQDRRSHQAASSAPGALTRPIGNVSVHRASPDPVDSRLYAIHSPIPIKNNGQSLPTRKGVMVPINKTTPRTIRTMAPTGSLPARGASTCGGATETTGSAGV